MLLKVPYHLSACRKRITFLLVVFCFIVAMVMRTVFSTCGKTFWGSIWEWRNFITKKKFTGRRHEINPDSSRCCRCAKLLSHPDFYVCHHAVDMQIHSLECFQIFPCRRCAAIFVNLPNQTLSKLLHCIQRLFKPETNILQGVSCSVEAF